MTEIEIDGVVRNLTHLEEFVVTLAGKGKNNANLRVAISFGLHTISRSCEWGDRNMTDENGKPRIFCEDRYAFSLGLPLLARRVVEENYFCWESSDRNRAMNYAVLDVAPGKVRELKDGEHQAIYFYLYPEKGAHADVRLVVTSCYPREFVFSRIKRRFNSHMLLRKCLFEQKRIP